MLEFCKPSSLLGHTCIVRLGTAGKLSLQIILLVIDTRVLLTAHLEVNDFWGSRHYSI